MSRSRFDSALSNDSGEAVPGEGLHMHELESDGEDQDQQHEGGNEDFAIQEDDVEDMQVSLEKEKDKKPVTAPTPSLQTLPSYQALMNSLSHDPSERKSSSSSSSAASSAVAAQINLDDPRFIQDDENAQAGSGSDNDDLDESQLKTKANSFEEMFSRAKRLETKGFLRKAAHYYLYCLEHFRYSHQHQDLIAMCLRRLGDICYKNKKYKEALQFRTAERMVYESNLLRIVKSDAEKEDAIARSSAPTSPSNAASSSPASSSSSSSSAAPLPNKNSRIMSQQSADPTPIIRTPITPKALIAEEERALTYERLAKVFFEEKNIDMAKSYALKAIEIRRRIKAKYGDPSKLDPEQLLLHQLAVMGQEEYESTLRRFKGQPSAEVQGLLSSEMDDDAAGDDEETEEGKTVSKRAAAKEAQLKFSMAKSLQALTSGKLNPKPAAAAKDDHEEEEEEEKKESDKLRQRKGGKQVNFKDAASKSAAADDNEKSGPDDAAAPADASKPDIDVSSVVSEKPVVSVGTKRRAMAVSLFAGALVILLAYYLITVTFRSTFFKPTGTGAFATK